MHDDYKSEKEVSKISFLMLVLVFFVLFREYASKIPRPFQVRYNPYTQNIEILDNKDKVLSLISEVKCDMDVLYEALKKV